MFFELMCHAFFQVKDAYQKARLHFQWRTRQVQQTKRDKATPEKKQERRLKSKRRLSQEHDSDEVSISETYENQY
jgi:hypothetical protein